MTKYQPFMIVTEYMTGGSISDIFRAGRFPSVWRGIQMALDCAKGLSYLHNRSPQVGAGASCSGAVCVAMRHSTFRVIQPCHHLNPAAPTRRPPRP